MTAMTIHIACLCAAWCRTCEAYDEVFRAACAELPQQDLRVHWIDIEDQADLIGDLDIETFPTLLIADDRQVRFAGPLTPQPETLRRMLRAQVEGDGHPAPGLDPAYRELAQRLRDAP
ncbi:MAG: thioredoxin [Roseateles depolymerans]|uniref:Thioredoxin n=1 Tax=Roseateles depolymerans TaxID=76731 RepID=A0A2W5FQ34_9BURK|nr:MAG: thioredoxin [Roseateles depolymerans]